MHSSCDDVVGDEDLLTEILLQLPVKEALRCKYNKHNAYIHPSGIFLRSYFADVNIIPFTNTSNNRLISLDVHDERLCPYFIQSCNGLLLWTSYPKEPRSSPLYAELVQKCSFYVSNPTTGQCVRIGPFGHDRSSSIPFLAFEPWKSPHYKVIFFNQGEQDVFLE
ncbi:hypothetical protein PIB30_002183 [Stylosanthes scabra]|uniref:F-box protein n=1 Tax=Stylosanthes scabra TaxID=79078 RepID=A0ABU6S343_9FABA|nr:hypothetical protein [Stylosanthes scabra]